MEKAAGCIITSVLLALTFCCWLSALIAPGWFLLEVEKSPLSSSLTNALFGESAKKEVDMKTEIDMGLFFINLCINDKCHKIDYDELQKFHKQQSMPEMMELQAEGVLALALCTISCLLVMIPARSKSTSYLISVIIMSIAVIVESVLIYRMASANVKVSDAVDKINDMESTLLSQAKTKMEVKFPYSILIAGFGVLLGILGTVSSNAMYRKSREVVQRAQVLTGFQVPPATGFTILQETY